MIRVSPNSKKSAGTAIAFPRMGSRSWCSRAFTALAVVLALSSLAVAQTNGTWTQTANGTYTWGTTTNWAGGIVAGGTGSVTSLTADTAAGGGPTTALQTINLNTTVTTGTLRWADTNATGAVTSYGIAAGTGGALNMATSDGSTPTILYVGASQNQQMLISAPITGTQGLRISSTGSIATGQVNLTGTSTFTGNITIDGGAVTYFNLLDTGRLGATGTFTGDISIGASATYRAWNSGLQTLSGNISGAGAIQMIASAYNTGTLALTGSNAYTGTINLNGVVAGSATQGRVLLLGNADAMRNAILSTSTSALENAGTRTVQFATGIGTFNLGGIAAGNLGTGNIGLTDTSSNAITLAVGHNNLASSYSGTFFGAGNLTKVGSGTLTLSAANTYTGTTAVNGGVLTISNAAALGTTGTITFGGGTLQYGSGITADLSARIRNSGSAIAVDTGANNVAWATGLASTNTGGLTKLGSGALTLSAANNYSGGTTIRNGSVAVTSPANLGAGAIAITPDAGTSNPSLRLNNTVSGTYTQPITMSSASNPAFAVVDASSATAQVTLSGGITVSNNAFLVRLVAPTGTTGSLVVDGNITGTGDLQLTGGGGAGVIQKDINIGSAILYVAGAGSTWSIGGGAYTWGTTNIQLAGSALRTTVDGVLPSSSALSFNSAAGALDINGTRQTVGSVGGSVAGSRIILGSGTLTVSNTNASTFAGVISGTGGGLVKTNSGTLTLSNTNTYTGTTAINGGVLSMGDAAALGTGTITFGGGTLQYGSGITTDLSGRIAASGSAISVDTGVNTVAWATGLASTNTGGLTKFGSGTLTLSGPNTYTGTTAVNAGVLQIGNNSTAGGLAASSAITGSSGATLAFNRTDDYGGNFGNAISGGLGVRVNSGTLTLSASNAYTGGSTISAGRLVVGHVNALGSSTSALAVNGTLDLAGRSISVGALSGSSGATITTSPAAGTATLTTTVNSNSTFAGSIADNGSGRVALTKTGSSANVLTLTGTNTFTGDISVAGGYLDLGTTGLLGNGNYGGNISIASAGGGQFRIMANANQTLSGTISGDGILWMVTGGAGTGTTTLTAANTFTGQVLAGNNFSSSGFVVPTLQLGNANALQSARLAVSASNKLIFSPGIGTFNVGSLEASGTLQGDLTLQDTSGAAITLSAGGNDRSTTYGRVLSGSGGLTKVGSGTLTLTGANTYSGATTISAGRLALSGGDNRLATNAPITITGGVLDLGSRGQTTSGAMSFQGGTVQSGTLTSTGGAFDGQAGTVSAILAGSGIGLTKTTSGTLTLSNANTYSGATTISDGRLLVGNAAALGSSSAALAVNGGTLDLGGFSVGVGALSGSAGAVITTATTAGTATLTSAVASGTSIFGGVIQDNGSGVVALTKSGAGVLALTGANTYSGATSVSAGTLLVTGQLGNTAVTVDSGATLGGSGSIAGAVTVNGFLSPGASPGVLSVASLVLGASSTSVFEIDGLTRGTQYDGVNITGLGGPTYGGTLSLSFLTSFDNDTTFDLFNFSGTPTGDFTTVISSGAYAGTWSQVTSGTWRLESGSQTVTFSQATGDIVVVPEPAALALAAIGIAAATWVRRRSISQPRTEARG